MGAVPGRTLVWHTWSPPDVKASEDFPATAHGGPVTFTPDQCGAQVTEKQALRTQFRQTRRDHEAAIPAAMRGLLFLRPPAPLLELVPPEATIGVYHPVGSEASPLGYARWFYEAGHPIALPWFADRAAPMRFRGWSNPFDEDELEPAPWGGRQPDCGADLAEPAVLIVPLLGFTPDGMRLGQGGGHYDRYLAANQDAVTIGIAWDCQLVDSLPVESHDMPLRAVVTPTRFYGPF
ncbi:MAG: 5-formyltetrahydrofolate cyclo-ligase [Proteobacteria bacterium]|nr:5-formyltetrahydrofolate cyclo-ligase [Pseudomonadota bacterium]MDE2411486.1 5-formyltetrahydrofolate cyclo-ligase [Sphingomonadales bacterium]